MRGPALGPRAEGSEGPRGVSPRRRGKRRVWEAADHPGAAARALRGERRWCSTHFWSRKGTTPVGAGRGRAAFSRDRHTHLYGDVQSHRFLKDGCKRSGWTLAPGAHRRDGPHAFCQQLHRTRLRWSPRLTDSFLPAHLRVRLPRTACGPPPSCGNLPFAGADARTAVTTGRAAALPLALCGRGQER